MPLRQLRPYADADPQYPGWLIPITVEITTTITVAITMDMMD